MKLPLKFIKTGKAKHKGTLLIEDDNEDLVAALIPVLYIGDPLTSVASMARARSNAEVNAYQLVKWANATPYIKDYLASRLLDIDRAIDSPLATKTNTVPALMRERQKIQNLLKKIQ